MTAIQLYVISMGYTFASLVIFFSIDGGLTISLFFQNLGGRVFETNQTIPKILPEALLKLFVDIEFTGHSLEFEQKFGIVNCLLL